jgi:MFS family permease
MGFALLFTNLAYAGLVAQGGRLSDRWGRARTAVLGAALCVAGALLGAAIPRPWAAVAGTVLSFAGTALFFPGNVGLFSDAAGASGAAAPPLHVKVSRYNLGWASGNLTGFAAAWLLSSLAPAAGFAAAVLAFAVGGLWLLRWWSLPPRPPAAEGDRAGHPALARLTFLGRSSVLVYCCLGMAVIVLLANALGREPGLRERAQGLATMALFAYALGYVLMFALLGRWTGWILRPWRLLALQAFLPATAIGLLLAGRCGLAGSAPLLFACGLSLGFAYGAVYTSSIYYSMRLPEGAARAASLHETALGVGSTLGPFLGGLFLTAWSDPGVAGLGGYLLIGSAVLLAWQAAQVPGVMRRVREAEAGGS